MRGSPTTLDQRHSDPDHDGADTQHRSDVSNDELINFQPQLQHNLRSKKVQFHEDRRLLNGLSIKNLIKSCDFRTVNNYDNLNLAQ